MMLIIDPAGTIRCVYEECLDLRSLGNLAIQRASHLEPDDEGLWWADLSPSGGPRLGPYLLRTAAISAETQWLIDHRISHTPLMSTSRAPTP